MIFIYFAPTNSRRILFNKIFRKPYFFRKKKYPWPWSQFISLFVVWIFKGSKRIEFFLLRYRYVVLEFPGGSLLRIEPVRRKPDLSEIECRAENGAGDPVYASASLTVYDGESSLKKVHTKIHFFSAFFSFGLKKCRVKSHYCCIAPTIQPCLIQFIVLFPKETQNWHEQKCTICNFSRGKYIVWIQLVYFFLEWDHGRWETWLEYE